MWLCGCGRLLGCVRACMGARARLDIWLYMICTCVRACVCACVRASVRACVRSCVRVWEWVWEREWEWERDACSRRAKIRIKAYINLSRGKVAGAADLGARGCVCARARACVDLSCLCRGSACAHAGACARIERARCACACARAHNGLVSRCECVGVCVRCVRTCMHMCE